MMRRINAFLIGACVGFLDRRGFQAMPVDEYERRIMDARHAAALEAIEPLTADLSAARSTLNRTTGDLRSVLDARDRALARAAAARKVLTKYQRYNVGGGRRARAVRRVARELLACVGDGV